MNRRHLIWSAIFASIATALYAIVAFAAPAPYRVVSISPSPFTPSTGKTTTITYTVSATSNPRLFVRNSAGAEVRGLVTYRGMSAGTYTRVWDGKDNTGRVVPNGTYTVVIQDTANVVPMGTGTVIVGSATPAPTPTPTTAYTVRSVTPSPLDPSKGSATITYTVPSTSNPRLFVRNSAGTEVRGLVTYSGMGAGTYTRLWDGKDNLGKIVPNGTYTVVVQDTLNKVAAGTGTVTVQSGTVTPPPPPPPPPVIDPTPQPAGGEMGQTIEGAGSANFDWTKQRGTKFGVAFKAPKSGTVKQFYLQWKKSSGYGAGTYGIFDFTLETNGSNNYPSGTVLASAKGVRPSQAMDGYQDGALHVEMTATLTAGQVYHLTMQNVDPNVASNWSSPNTLMSRVKPWGDFSDSRGECYQNGQWRPWTSNSNVWNNGGGNYVNGSHVPVGLVFTDGTWAGDPYYSSAISAGAYFHGANKHGQHIVWDRATTQIKRVGVSVGKKGTPGTLIYHLEEVGGAKLATGTIATASQIGSAPTWVYATLPSPVTLSTGKSYRLWFESPTSSSSSSCYYQYIVYGENRPAQWIGTTWGGTKSYYTKNTGGSWSTGNTNMDMSFSLQ